MFETAYFLLDSMFFVEQNNMPFKAYINRINTIANRLTKEVQGTGHHLMSKSAELQIWNGT
jgi:hypothetical protein